MYICNLFRNYNSRMRYKNGELFMMVGWYNGKHR
jgi:hypothetical protein